jgi:AcrR family transcriptional regulator
MRYDDNHKERTRARVLAEAAAAIRSKGAERVGVAEIMAGAGLTHGGFYAHFKSKDDLVAQAITHMFDASYAWFLRHTEGRDPADALSNYIDARSCPRLSDRGTFGRSAQPARAGSGPLHGRHRATRCRFREAREEAGREECRCAGLVGHCGDGGCARAVAYRVRRRQGDANPPQFAGDGSVTHRPRSIGIRRRLTASE